MMIIIYEYEVYVNFFVDLYNYVKNVLLECL